MGIETISFATPLYFSEQSYIGGGERYPINLAKAILMAAPANVRVEIVSFGPEAVQTRLDDRLEMRVLPAGAANGNPLDSVSLDICNALDGADLVHVHQAFTRSSQVSILAAKFLGATLCVTDHGGRTNHLDKIVDYLELADLLVFYSQFAATMIRSERPRRIIPGGVDTTWFAPPLRPRERTHILFVGRLLPHKGVDRLIAAVPADIPLVICGRPTNREYAEYLVAIARRRSVEFVHDASDEEIRSLYQSAWATVLPSVHLDAWDNVYLYPELMGLTALESMACGTPAIVSTAGALSEFVQNGRTGHVFTSLPELGSFCRDFANNPSKSDRMGLAAKVTVEEHFSLPVVGKALWQAYCAIPQ